MEVLPVKQVKHNEDKSVKPPFVKPSFLGVIFGGVRSGKSCLLINLLYRVYDKEIFDGGMYFFSPNVNNDDIFESNVAIDEDIIKFDQDLEHVDLYVKAIVEKQKQVKKDQRKHILLVFDDILGFIKQGSYIANLCSRYRQLKISLIFVTQLFRGIPNVIRSNASWMVLFKTYNEKEKDKITEEMGHIKDFEKHYDEATDKKYGFVYVNLKDMKVYDCFTKCLYDHDRDGFNKNPE